MKFMGKRAGKEWNAMRKKGYLPALKSLGENLPPTKPNMNVRFTISSENAAKIQEFLRDPEVAELRKRIFDAWQNYYLQKDENEAMEMYNIRKKLNWKARKVGRRLTKIPPHKLEEYGKNPPTLRQISRDMKCDLSFASILAHRNGITLRHASTYVGRIGYIEKVAQILHKQKIDSDQLTTDNIYNLDRHDFRGIGVNPSPHNFNKHLKSLAANIDKVKARMRELETEANKKQ